MVSEWSITDLIKVDFDKLVIYYEQINGCEVTDGPLADHSGTVVIADSGPRRHVIVSLEPFGVGTQLSSQVP